MEELLSNQKSEEGGSNCSLGFLKALGDPKYILKKAKRLNLALLNDILRHTLVYFLVGCTSAEPTSAFTSVANIKNVNGIQD